MASSLDKWFAPFEGTRSAYPLAIFRIGFFSGLALHFFPSLMNLDEAYRPGALRTLEWSEWLYGRFWHVPHGDLRLWALVTIAACVMGIVGVLPRLAAILSGVGCYVFASFNGLHLQTLALVDAWAILLAWMLCGGGAGALSLEALVRKPAGAAREPRLLSALVLFQVLLGVFFAGVEKVIAGWPWSNEMGVVLSYPRGFIVRDWVASSGWIHASVVTHALTWFTIIVELGAPIGLVFRRTRRVSLALWELLFLGIILMLEVPPLFYATFAFGPLLALDDDEVEHARSWLARALSRVSRRQSA
jgi:hypothetical protein